MDAEERADRQADLRDDLEALLSDSRLLCAGSRDYRQRAGELCMGGRKLLGISRQLGERSRRQALALLERAAGEGIIG